MSAALTVGRPRSRRILLLLVALFFAPLLLSFLMYYGSSWRPTGRTNHGILIEPARPLAAASAVFIGKWSLVYVGNGACDAACHQALYFMRQTQLGLGHLLPRVQRVFVATAQCCDQAFFEREHPGLLTVDPPENARAQLLAPFPSDARDSTLFIVDPRGNLMMRYDDHADPRGLHEDLEKLLNLSHIG
jgi:hypothetical protein